MLVCAESLICDLHCQSVVVICYDLLFWNTLTNKPGMAAFFFFF